MFGNWIFQDRFILNILMFWSLLCLCCFLPCWFTWNKGEEYLLLPLLRFSHIDVFHFLRLFLIFSPLQQYYVNEDRWKSGSHSIFGALPVTDCPFVFCTIGSIGSDGERFEGRKRCAKCRSGEWETDILYGRRQTDKKDKWLKMLNWLWRATRIRKESAVKGRIRLNSSSSCDAEILKNGSIAQDVSFHMLITWTDNSWSFICCIHPSCKQTRKQKSEGPQAVSGNVWYCVHMSVCVCSSLWPTVITIRKKDTVIFWPFRSHVGITE